MIISILFFAITETGRNIYRPFIYENSINDFGVADSIGNSGGIVVQIYLILFIMNSPRRKVPLVILFITCGYIVYEIIQPLLPRGVFDIRDIIGTIIGGLISTLIYYQLIQRIKDRIFFKLR